MREAFQKYLDKRFSSYKKSKALNDFKEELLSNLNERFEEFKAEGLSDNESYKRSIESLGDYSDALKTLDAHTPAKTMVTYSKLILSVSALYFVLLITAYLGISFLTKGWSKTWLIVLVGSVLYVVVMFILNSKNALANQKNGKMRFNVLAIFTAVMLLSYFFISFVTKKWGITWLIPIDFFAVWLVADIFLTKLKKKKAMRIRISFAIMTFAAALYLTVSELISGIWSFSWLIVLGGVIIMLAYLTAQYYGNYRDEIKSGKDDD
ncbi:MAG: permease prefix domain 1-containing protein [Clostridiales bacterium]|jgi:hypothetical protein|nr:permease prefix domain 1-containing protein [Clostridiales bacterium]